MNRIEAIRLLGDWLSPTTEGGDVEALRERLARDASACRRLVEVSSEHWVTPALRGTLARRGLLPALPDDFRDFIEATADLNAERNAAILEQLAEAVAALNDVGVTPLLIKGAALLGLEVYPESEGRILQDLDLLVPRDAAGKCAEALHRIGYEAQDGTVQVAHHLAPLLKPGRPVVVELHVEVGGGPSAAEPTLPAVELWDRSLPLEWRGLRARVPSPGDMALYCVLHEQVHHRRHLEGGFSMRQLLDLVLIARRWDGEIDWPGLLELAGRGERRLEVETNLLLAGDLLGLPIPDVVTTPDLARRAARAQIGNQRSAFHGWLGRWRGRAGAALGSPRRFARFALHLLSPRWYIRRASEAMKLIAGRRP